LDQQRDAVIGREKYCDVVLMKRTISHQHARVVFDGRRYQVEDLGSAHGTFLNVPPRVEGHATQRRPPSVRRAVRPTIRACWALSVKSPDIRWPIDARFVMLTPCVIQSRPAAVIVR
jgi:hypothetical protein